jgi:hypothetical protein
MKLPIETGRWYNISKDHRKCTKCSEHLIGDEFHYLFICFHPEIVNFRVRYIPNYYLRNSNKADIPIVSIQCLRKIVCLMTMSEQFCQRFQDFKDFINSTQAPST